MWFYHDCQPQLPFWHLELQTLQSWYSQARMEKDQYTQQLLLVISRKSTWSSKWPWRSSWAIFPIHILIKFHIDYHNIIYFPFDFKKQWPVVETNGNQVPPQQVQGRISLSPLDRSLANIAGNMCQFISSSMVFPPNSYISIYLYILFRYIYTTPRLPSGCLDHGIL